MDVRDETPWTKAQFAMVGTVPDREVARATGYSLSAVFYARHKLGVTNYAVLLERGFVKSVLHKGDSSQSPKLHLSRT